MFGPAVVSHYKKQPSTKLMFQLENKNLNYLSFYFPVIFCFHITTAYFEFQAEKAVFRRQENHHESGYCVGNENSL